MTDPNDTSTHPTAAGQLVAREPARIEHSTPQPIRLDDGRPTKREAFRNSMVRLLTDHFCNHTVLPTPEKIEEIVTLADHYALCAYAPEDR